MRVNFEFNLNSKAFCMSFITLSNVLEYMLCASNLDSPNIQFTTTYMNYDQTSTVELIKSDMVL